MFKEDVKTGELTKKPCLNLQHIIEPLELESSADKKYLYIVGWQSNNIGVVSINYQSETMTLEQVVPTGISPAVFAIAPDNDSYAYLTNYNSDSLTYYDIDTATGKLNKSDTKIPLNIINPAALTYSSDLKYLYINSSTGNIIKTYKNNYGDSIIPTPLPYPDVSTGVSPFILYNLHDILYQINVNSQIVNEYRITSDGGKLAPIQNIPINGIGTYGISFDAKNKRLYLFSMNNNEVDFFKLDDNYIADEKTHQSQNLYNLCGVMTTRQGKLDSYGHAYTYNVATNTVSSYYVNQKTGLLSCGKSYNSGGISPWEIAIIEDV